MSSSNETKQPVIICGGGSGRAVVFGYADEIPAVDRPCELTDARMVLRWGTACGGLLGLAAKGPRGPQGETRLTASVPMLRDTPQQVIAVSAKAAERFNEWTDVS